MALQLYLLEEAVEDLAGTLRKIAGAGFDGLCLTLDTVVYGRRERDLRRGFRPAGGAIDAASIIQPGLTWDTIRRIRDQYDGPLMAKGVATAEDASLLIETGFDAIWVSNHGGRQLDHARPSIESLREVAPVTAGKAVTIMDGGICRGTDVVKALALGADSVAVGKMVAVSCAANLVERYFEILEEELSVTLINMGARGVAELSESHVSTVGAIHDAPLFTRSDDVSSRPANGS